ncbi:FmdB family zinc ribbon protein [Sedimentitalea nanhaiensis]|uniref:Putative regulatory protein, FmdB family n=1 Tax=Sedimentitalea nanhaiensis TaxID=999627 RepID=A0A1I7DWR4_9RHOB|nr:putative regulatory protein, FmdB family [Sedimentitalea nanhaiensis]
MPIYTYTCNDCGTFDTWRTIVDATNEINCPICTKPSPRQVALPGLNLMNSTLRGYMSRSEKSGNEPRVVNKKHLAGCGCPICKIGKPKERPTRYKWMIGH